MTKPFTPNELPPCLAMEVLAGSSGRGFVTLWLGRGVYYPGGEVMSEPIKKMERHSAEYHDKAIRLAMDFAPPMNPCAECGGPVVSGYCCTHCGSVDPPGR